MKATRLSIENLSKATSKDVFEHIVKHLFTQKEQSKLDGDKCRYRIESEGKLRRCAAGCLIPKRKYQDQMEYQSWSELVEMGLVPHYHQTLILAMQQVHDGDYGSPRMATWGGHGAYDRHLVQLRTDQPYRLKYWFDSCKEVAKQYGIRSRILDQYKPLVQP